MKIDKPLTASVWAIARFGTLKRSAADVAEEALSQSDARDLQTFTLPDLTAEELEQDLETLRRHGR